MRPPPTLAVLPFRPPLDWTALLAFFAYRAIPGVERVEDGVYRRVIGLGGAAGTLAVRRASEDTLEAAVRFPEPGALPEILRRVRPMFDLDTEPSAIAAHLTPDPRLAPLIAARPGLRVPGNWDGFELSVRALLGQQITVVGARNLGARLAARLGAPLDEAWREDGLARAFPSAAALAALDPATLPMPGARARALTTLAAEALAEPELFGAYPSLEAAIARLKRLKGIGDWTAHYIALRGLKHPDAFPAGDLGLMRALAAPDGTRPSAAALLARAEGWRPWRAYAAQHLWTADAAITFAQIT